MLSHRRNGEAAQRFAERRQREDSAQRLKDAVPSLTSLKLEVEERRSGGVVAEASHIRRIVVDNAPALFVLTCGDPTCKEGGHDVTHAIMRGLSAGSTRFDGEDVCHGIIGTASCGRTMKWTAIAEYGTKK